MRTWTTAQLAMLAAYWLGITALWIGLGQILAGRLVYEGLVEPGTEGAALFRMTALGTLVALAVQPAVGVISDDVRGRFGRRRPFMVAGALADLVFLAGVASGSSVLAIAGLYLALQVASNLAQGPYQALIPDLVPEDQYGVASALVALMVISGNIVGFVVGALAVATGAFLVATLALGVIEVAALVFSVLVAREAPSGGTSTGRPKRWTAVRSAWGRDLFDVPGFGWFVGSRLLVLAGAQSLVSFAVFYLSRSLGLGRVEAGTALLALLGVVAVGTGASVMPAARASDRLGRRPVIWVACALGIAALVTCALAPNLPVAFVGGAVFGIAGGAFLAVDWALLVSLVPARQAARFLGVSNVATTSAGLVAVIVSGTVMDCVGRIAGASAGPRAALIAGAACYAVGAGLLLRVPEPRVRRGDKSPMGG